jgi:hypothetical protein
MKATHEFLLHLRVYAAWMPTVWGWVEDPPPPEGPPPHLWFHVQGRADGNGDWIATIVPPTNSADDIALMLAILGSAPPILFIEDDSMFLNEGSFYDVLCIWHVGHARYEFNYLPL